MPESDGKRETQQPKQPWPRRVLRMTVKVFLWVMGVLFSLLLLAWVVLLLLFPDDKVRRILVEQLSDRLGVQVDAGNLEFHWLRGLVLKDVVVHPPPGFTQSPFSMRALIVDYSLSDLLHKKLVVRRVLLDRPAIKLESVSGQTNLQVLMGRLQAKEASPPPPKASEQGESGFLIDLESVKVQDASLEMENNGIKAQLQGIEFQLSGQWGAPEKRCLRWSLALPLPQAAEANVFYSSPAEASGQKAQAASPSQAKAALAFHLEGTWEGAQNLSAFGSLDLSSLLLPWDQNPHRLHLELNANMKDQSPAQLSMKAVFDDQPVLSCSGTCSFEGERPAFEITFDRIQAPMSIMNRFLRERLLGTTIAGEIALEDLQIKGALGKGFWPRVSGRLRLQNVGWFMPRMQVGALAGKADFTLEPQSEGGGSVVIQGGLSAVKVREREMEADRVQLDWRAKTLIQMDEAGLRLDAPELAIQVGALRLRNVAAVLENPNLKLQLECPKQSIRSVDNKWIIPALLFSAHGGTSVAQASGGRLDGVVFEAHGSGQMAAVAASAGELHLEAQRAAWNSIVLDKPKIDVSLKASQGGKIKDVHLRELVARIQAGRLVSEGMESGTVDLQITTRPVWQKSEAIPLTVGLVVEKMVVRQTPQESVALPGPLRLDSQAAFDRMRGRLELINLSLKAEGLFGLNLEGWFGLEDQSAELKLKTSPIPLEKLLALIPLSRRTSFPDLSGQVTLDGWLQGRIPQAGGSWDPWPLSAKGNILLQGVGVVSSNPRIVMQNLSGQIQGSVGPDLAQQEKSVIRLTMDRFELGQGMLKARGMFVDLSAMRTSGDLVLKGKVGAAKIEPSGILPEVASGADLIVDATLMGMKELWLQNLELKLPAIGLSFGARGQLVWPSDVSGLSEIRASCELSTTFRSEQAIGFPGGFNLKGGAEVALKLESRAAGAVDVLGKITFTGLDVEFGRLGFSKMQGMIPVSQRVAILPEFGLLAGRAGMASSEESAKKRSPAYEDALLPIKRQHRDFSIEKVRYQDLRFSGVSGDLELAEGLLSLSSLRFGFLGGDVLAQMSLLFAPPGTRQLLINGEMSGIDLAELGALSLSGDSEINGNLKMQADFSRQEVSIGINLTQIGRSTLQAMLVAMDPQEKNPGVVLLRKNLERFDISPEQVSLSLRHGLLGLEITFNMGLLASAVKIEGFEGRTYRLKQPVGGFLEKYLRF